MAVKEFNDKVALTVEDMNSLLQKGHIVQTIGDSESTVMSQKAVKTALAGNVDNGTFTTA